MAITVADNFSYQGKKPLDGRDTFATLAAMKAYAEASVYDGCLSYCDEDGKRYEFKSTNTVDPTTGKWREYSSGGGGETYSDFTGATASTAGAHGLVPAPSAGDEGKVLFGNGAWGALPSVDLSVLSNEAFIFSTDEKPVGMWTDRKLVYSKTFTYTLGSTSSNTWTDIGTLNDVDTVVGYFGSVNTNNFTLGANFFANPSIDISANKIKAFHTGMSNQPIKVVAFYTKTTDSPLASDVKFAGVTSSGEVILKKEYTGLSVTPVYNSWVKIADAPANAGKVYDCQLLFGDSGYTTGSYEIAFSANKADVNVEWNTSANVRTINTMILYYTLVS